MINNTHTQQHNGEHTMNTNNTNTEDSTMNTDTTTDHNVATRIAEALQDKGIGKPSLHEYMMEIILAKMNPEQPKITQTICRRCKRPMAFTQTKESDGTYTPDAWGECRGCKRRVWNADGDEIITK